MNLESDFAEINVDPCLSEVLASQRVSWLVPGMSQRLGFASGAALKVLEFIFAAVAGLVSCLVSPALYLWIRNREH